MDYKLGAQLGVAAFTLVVLVGLIRFVISKFQGLVELILLHFGNHMGEVVDAQVKTAEVNARTAEAIKDVSDSLRDLRDEIREGRK